MSNNIFFKEKNILKGKTALITGAAHGVGAAISLQLAKEGCNLLLVDCDENKLKDTAGEIKALGIEPILHVCNLANANEREGLFQLTTKKDITIEILVNNVSVGFWATFMSTPEEKLEEIINVNIKCTTHLTKIFLPGMIEKNEGHIINLSSTGAFIGGPHIVCYCATKAYIQSFSESLSMELSKTGVNVLAACIGATDTHFWKYAGMAGTSYEQKIHKMSAQEVAQNIINALKKNKSDIVVGIRNKFIRLVVKLSPREWIKKLALHRFEK